MRLLIKDRGTGKTTQLIHTSEATGYPIITHNETAAQNIIRMAEMMGVHIPTPISISKIEHSGLRGFRLEGVLIDEGYDIIEKALEEYIGCQNIVAVTLSDKLKEISKMKVR